MHCSRGVVIIEMEVQFLPKDGLPSRLAEKMLYMYIKKDLFILMYIWYWMGIGNSVFKDLLFRESKQFGLSTPIRTFYSSSLQGKSPSNKVQIIDILFDFIKIESGR